MSEDIRENELTEKLTDEAVAAEPGNAAEKPVTEKKTKKGFSPMKAFVFALAAICLIYAGAIGWKSFKAGEFVAPFTKLAGDAASEVTIKGINYEKLYKTHSPDDIALTISGTDITWSEYFTWVYNMGEQVVSYMQQMAMYYGAESDWSDVINDYGDTYYTVVASGAEDYLKQLVCIEKFSETVGADISDEDRVSVQQSIETAKLSTVGEDGTDEQFRETLAGMYITPDFYERNLTNGILYTNSFNALYGEDLSLISDEDALKYLEDNGYMHVMHILFYNTDADTGEALSEEALAEKVAQAQSICDELNAIADKEERAGKFEEYMNELTEDAGIAGYPGGYTFQSGRMEAAFEQASAALEEYEVSEPIESSYGYHVIIRLPLNPDDIIEYDTSTYEPISGRSLYADDDFAARMQAMFDTLTVEYKEGFGNLNLPKYMKTISD